MKNTSLSANRTKQEFIADIIASLLLLLFVHGFLTSVTQIDNLKGMLGFYTKNTTSIAWIILFAEAATATLIFMLPTRTIGFICALLIIAFAAITMLQYPRNPHDFGGIFNNISRPQKWLLIIVTTLLCCTGIVVRLIKNTKH